MTSNHMPTNGPKINFPNVSRRAVLASAMGMALVPVFPLPASDENVKLAYLAWLGAERRALAGELGLYMGGDGILEPEVFAVNRFCRLQGPASARAATVLSVVGFTEEGGIES